MPKAVQNKSQRGALVIAGAIVVLGLAGCRESSAAAKAPAVQQGNSVPTDAAPAVLASVDNQPVTMADVRTKAGDQLDQLETQYQLAKSKIIRSSLDSILRDKTLGAEAKKKGKSVDELIASEAGPNGFNATDEQITKWYNDNPQRVGTRPLDQVKSQIADLLRNENRQGAERRLRDRLSSEHKVAVNYEGFRLQFNNDKAPTIGSKNAPITLVEFSDFQCPYCKGMAPTLKEVAKKLGDKVQIVYRQYPIPSLHPFATKAAEASLCANEQGKFWELHDKMFDDQTKLAVSDLKATARQLGMDGKKFDQCLDSGRYVEHVQNVQREGQRAGVNGTPAVFINGVELKGGSVPYSVVEAAIQQELSVVKR